jgi:hypothetical protein
MSTGYLIALLFQIDREPPNFFGNLDFKKLALIYTKMRVHGFSLVPLNVINVTLTPIIPIILRYFIRIHNNSIVFLRIQKI